MEAISDDAPLIVTSAVRDRDYQRLLARRERSGDPRLLAAHDRLRVRHPARLSQPPAGCAFQFWLDRLQAMNLITWVREAGAIHITVAKDTRRLLAR